MKATLKDFQIEAVAALRSKFAKMQADVGDERGAVLLNAPTGSGKTLIATALIEELLTGSETDGTDGEPNLIFLWLTDQPELNKQTVDKMLATSTELSKANMTVIDAGLDAERLEPGHLYFLNTQKLGAGTTFVKPGDGRTHTLWETLSNTVVAVPTEFVLILDEAHRGARGRDAAEAETIMQKFLKGNGEMTPVPLVIGISATPDRFVTLCSDTSRVLRRVDVVPAEVRQSGLLKEYVDLFHPDEVQPSHATMLQEAIGAWQHYCREWGAYKVGEGEEAIRPVLLVQVQDSRSGSASLSATDMGMVVSTLVRLVPHAEGNTTWLAHAFQDDTELDIAGYRVRHIAPSDIASDDNVKVVLFKTSLNTGWDCPRAETMVSFRTAKDETNIAQLVGRMVRAPLARRVEDNEHLNTVALYLPYYDRDTVEKVIARLTSDPDNVPPTMVRDGRQAVTLTRAENKEGCFKVLASLPTYVIPRIRPMRPVPRLAKLAALLNELGWESDPVKIYRSTLVKVLLEERKRLAAAAEFKSKVDENAMLDIRRRRVAYAAVAPDNATTEGKVRAKIADQNIDDLYAEAGRFLGEGLHKEYLRTRRKNASKKEVHDSAREKLELHALVTTDGVLDKVNAAADALRKTWTATHKGAVKDAEEKSRQIWRDIEGGGIDPERTVITPPSSIEGQKGVTAWRDHVYVDASGAYCEDFTSSWESRALATELGHREVVGWLRNQDRKPWSLCVKRRAGAKWVGIYPDFIIFRATGSGIVADIVDPHLLNDKDAPDRAKALAQYAADHSDSFGRIELLIYENASDTVGKRLDVMDEGTRKKVASVSSHEHLRQLFDSL